jgi:hypothetical protein
LVDQMHQIVSQFGNIQFAVTVDDRWIMMVVVIVKS